MPRRDRAGPFCRQPAGLRRENVKEASTVAAVNLGGNFHGSLFDMVLQAGLGITENDICLCPCNK